jgi:hypothetical protein
VKISNPTYREEAHSCEDRTSALVAVRTGSFCNSKTTISFRRNLFHRVSLVSEMFRNMSVAKLVVAISLRNIFEALISIKKRFKI